MWGDVLSSLLLLLLLLLLCAVEQLSFDQNSSSCDYFRRRNKFEIFDPHRHTAWRAAVTSSSSLAFRSVSSSQPTKWKHVSVGCARWWAPISDCHIRQLLSSQTSALSPAAHLPSSPLLFSPRVLFQLHGGVRVLARREGDTHRHTPRKQPLMAIEESTQTQLCLPYFTSLFL